jgi:tetratricopeptide (TPR) repeat protein
MTEDALRQAAESLNAGDHARAEALCQQVLNRAPDDPDALHLLGILRLQAGRAAEAIPLLRGALLVHAGNLSVLDALSAALMTVGDYAQAEDIVRRALAVDRDLPVASMRLGMALASQGKWDQAAQAFDDAARGDPQFAEAHHNLGNALMELHRPREAVTCFQRALALDPLNPDTHSALGAALLGAGRLDEAMECFGRALELDGNHAPTHLNLGNALLERGELGQAQQRFERVIALQPDNAAAHGNLGVVLQELGRWDEAMACQERALALDPQSADARGNLALLRLFRLEFEQAWPVYDERRRLRSRGGIAEGLRRNPASASLFERLPHWKGPGETVAGAVAIWGEQGIGDQVLYSTLIPELVGAGVPFVYEIDGRLLPAYERAYPGSRFVPLADPPREELQRASRGLFAGSLPLIFRRSRADFARQPAKLLGALPVRTAHYRSRLAALGPGLKVALSWQSKREGRFGARKSVPLTQFAPLLKLSGIRFVDVQYGDTVVERRAAEQATGVKLLRFDEVDYYKNLEELFAILEACDLVVTTSNATAHFAGALGKRTWLLYPADNPPFHYWAHGGSYRSLWYPSVEIVTAAHLAEWASLIEYAASKLSARQA